MDVLVCKKYSVYETGFAFASSHSAGIWLTVSPILPTSWVNEVHMDNLSVPYCSLAPQFKDLHLHSTVVNFLDLVITCSNSDSLNS